MGVPHFPNYAGKEGAEADHLLEVELIDAGIEVTLVPECMRGNVSSEIGTIVMGSLHRWSFKRSWRYWVAKGPGIELEYATPLHEGLGQEVRVDGHCACPSPLEWFGGFAVGAYHVDTPRGLKGLADVIKQIAKRA